MTHVIDVSLVHLFVAMAPLLFISMISWHLELDIESPVLVGTARTFIQLSILSLILDPIFVRGEEQWWLVVAYALLMVLLAAYESSTKSQYYFPGMFWGVLLTFLANLSWVSLFAFGIIIQPQPLWDPQYVIPIIGMLLGNCINGVSLSLNTLLTSMVESSREVELLLCFGATPYEASWRLLREAVRTGMMPQLNSMAIIGIISIPGMMTGQILGGSTVTEAARYQILITYLIAVCCFAMVLTNVFLALKIGFDSRLRLRIDRLRKRAHKSSPLCFDGIRGYFTWARKRRRSSSSSVPTSTEELTQLLAPKGKLSVTTSKRAKTRLNGDKPILDISDLSFSFSTGRGENADHSRVKKNKEDEVLGHHRVLFQNISFEINMGGVALVSGPSGVGKSSLFRILAGLAPLDGGSNIRLCGKAQSGFKDMTIWRKQIMYVPQTRTDFPGTPYSLLKTIASFKVCERDEIVSPSYSDMKTSTRDIIQSWGMHRLLLDSEWKILSGGESQRILVAMALASRPKIIMLDESTSALDLGGKVRVEATIKNFCEEHGMCAIWITHDKGQQDRMQMD